MKRVRGSREEHGGCGNYYITRVPGLEADVAISYITKGRRSSFKNVDIKVTPRQLTHVAGDSTTSLCSMTPTTP
jgi:hypothetical protein